METDLLQFGQASIVILSPTGELFLLCSLFLPSQDPAIQSMDAGTHDGDFDVRQRDDSSDLVIELNACYVFSWYTVE